MGAKNGLLHVQQSVYNWQSVRRWIGEPRRRIASSSWVCPGDPTLCARRYGLHSLIAVDDSSPKRAAAREVFAVEHEMRSLSTTESICSMSLVEAVVQRAHHLIMVVVARIPRFHQVVRAFENRAVGIESIHQLKELRSRKVRSYPLSSNCDAGRSSPHECTPLFRAGLR